MSNETDTETVVPDEVLAGVKRDAKVATKPLSATQAKNLEKVINNDFDTVAAELRAAAADARVKAQAEVEAQYNVTEEEVAAIRAEIVELSKAQTIADNELSARHREEKEALVEAQRAEAQDLYNRITARNLEIQTSTRYGGSTTLDASSVTDAQILVGAKFIPAGKTEALKVAVAKVEAQIERATLLLQRERLNAQRKVLLSSIVGDEAVALLESIPAAKDLFATALVEAEAVKALNEG